MPKLILDGDAKGAVKAHGELTESQKRTKEGIDQIGKAAWETHRKMTEWAREQKKEMSSAAAESKRMGDEARKIILDNEGPQERYNRKVGELSRLFVAGKLSLEQMDAALKRYRGELTSVVPAQESAFGASALSSATGYFTSLFGPAALVTGAIQILRNYKQELASIGQQLEGGRSGLGQLTQLASTAKDPSGKMRALTNEAKQIYASGATQTLGEAGQLVFTLESANITDPKQRKRIANMLSYGVIPEATRFSASIAALRSAYPDLSPDKLMGMGIVAALPSPGGAEQIIQAAGKSGEQMRALGWTPQFGLAATSILSRTYGGAEEGGVRLEQFAKQIERYGYAADPSLRGMEPFGLIQKIQKETGGDQNKLAKYLGHRMEAMQGFRTLANNLDEVRGLTAAAGGADGSLVDRAITLAQQTPEIDTARQGVASRNLKTLSRVPAANLESLYQSMVEQQVAGSPWYKEWIFRFGAGMFGQTEAAKQMQIREAVGDPFYTRELQESIVRYLQSIDSKTRTAPAASGRQEK